MSNKELNGQQRGRNKDRWDWQAESINRENKEEKEQDRKKRGGPQGPANPRNRVRVKVRHS